MNGLAGVAVSILGFGEGGYPIVEFQTDGLFELLAKKMISSANTRDNALRESGMTPPRRAYGGSGGGGVDDSFDAPTPSTPDAACGGSNTATAIGGGGSGGSAGTRSGSTRAAGDAAGAPDDAAGNAGGGSGARGGHTRRAVTGSHRVDGGIRGGTRASARGGNGVSCGELRIATTDERAPRNFGSPLTNVPVAVMRIPKPQPVAAAVPKMNGRASIERWLDVAAVADPPYELRNILLNN